MKTYSHYSVDISCEPSFYGSTCTSEDAQRIARDLADAIEAQFDGIAVFWGPSWNRSVKGPDEQVREEIRTWIQDNWISVL